MIQHQSIDPNIFYFINNINKNINNHKYSSNRSIMSENNEEEFQVGEDEYMVYHVDEHKIISIEQSKILAPNLKQIPKLQLKVIENKKQFTPPKRRALDGFKSIDQQIKGDNKFHFDKKFQSGNLYSVEQRDDNTYLLKISVDTNSNRQAQWFYFSCQGLSQANFIISGFQKTDSLYNNNMKICINEKGEWKRGGQKISYEFDQQIGSYCLKFSYKFQNSKNKVYFAYSYPYTYTQLEHYINGLEKLKLDYVKCEIFNKSILKNNIYCINIGNPQSKDVIVLTARIHPGESISSYIVKGFIEKLISKSKENELLRQRFLFKIFPMVNPDGVVLGNYRFSYSGHDLNRKWKDTSQKLHPQIYHIKKSLIEISKEKKIAMIFDIHGHSRKKNIFFYGCYEKSKIFVSPIAKQFPFLMSRIDKNFKYENCCFNIQKQKQGTTRIAMYNILKNPFVYTIQSSFCGSEQSANNYTIQDLIKFGHKLCEGLSVYTSQDFVRKKKSNYGEEYNIIQSLINKKKIILNEFYGNKNYLNGGMNIDDVGSESAPSQGCLREEQLLNLLELNKQEGSKKMQCSRNKSNQRPFRPLTSKRLIKKNPLQNKTDNTNQFKINIINGSLFDKKYENLQDKSRLTSRSKLYTSGKELESILEDYKFEFQTLGKTQKNLIYNTKNLGTQYKRVKNYAQQLMREEKIREERSLQLKNNKQKKQINNNQKVIINSDKKLKEEFKILKINQATFNLKNITTPLFSPRKKKSNDDYFPTGYFNVSIKARDYIEQKRNTRNTISQLKQLLIKKQN